MINKLFVGLSMLLLNACHKAEEPKEEVLKLEVTHPLRKDTSITKSTSARFMLSSILN